MGLCDDCKVLEFDEKDHGGYSKKNEEGKEVLWFDVEPQGHRKIKKLHLKYQRDVTFADLESMVGVCDFCSLIRYKLLEDFSTHKKFELRELWYEWEGGCLKCLILGFWVPGEYESGIEQEGRLDCYRETPYVWSSIHDHHHISLDVFAEPGNCARWLGTKNRTVIPKDILSSERSVSTMKNWLNIHVTETDSTIPTRLIDVRPPDAAVGCRLVHTSEGFQDSDLVKYVALSHCWGNPNNPPLKTTKAKIPLYQQQGFSDQCMPATYQDAVETVRRLDIKYLWIDSLCIVQDDMQDWERESVKMSEIYRGAAVTIVPLTAKSCHDGFLKRWPKPTAEIHHHSCLRPGVDGKYHLRVPGGSSASEILGGSTWDTRGWTFQEGMFSMKKLYFGKHKVIFESHGLLLAEDEVQEKPEKWQYTSLSRLREGNPEGEDSSVSNWYGMIEKYTKRNLTFESDRLPGFSSYAKNFAALTGCHYLAGLWREELHRGLLWSAYPPIPESKLLDFIEATNGASFTAPSWSWARGSGPVRHILYHAPSRERHPPEAREPLEAVMLDAGVKVDGLNEFGRVSDGYIRISGKMRSLSEMTAAGEHPDYEGSCDATLNGKLIARCWTDWLVLFQDGLWMREFPKASVEGILMLLLCPIPESTRQRWDRGLGVLLLPTEKAGTYQRVGLFESFDESVFESVEFREVTIV